MFDKFVEDSQSARPMDASAVFPISATLVYVMDIGFLIFAIKYSISRRLA